MYKYWADLSFNTNFDNCYSAIRSKDGIYEAYFAPKGGWKEDVTLARLHLGEIDVEPITQKKAKAIIKRLDKQYGGKKDDLYRTNKKSF